MIYQGDRFESKQTGVRYTVSDVWGSTLGTYQISDDSGVNVEVNASELREHFHDMQSIHYTAKEN